MKIALAHSHPNTLGGGERALLEVAGGLSAVHAVRLLVGDYQPERTYAELARLPMKRLGAKDWFTAPLHVDEVAVTNSFGANLLALRQGPRVICWVHSLRGPFLQPGRVRPDLIARRVLDWVALRRAALVVANSRYTAGRMAALYGRPADAVVYPGVRVPAETRKRQPRGLAITVGRLSPEKGLNRLLTAWHSLPEIPLKVVGTGESSFVASLKARAPSCVELAGPLTGSALLDALSDASVAVFSPYDEELGIAPLEAMAAGIPVVAWRSGGIPETVVDGATGFLVDSERELAARVRQIVDDKILATSLGEAGRARAALFSWERTVTALEQLCRQVLDRHGRRR